MNRLADEAMYFGAVADGVESQQEKIADLRQQLANALAANEHNLRVYHAAAAELRQQLAAIADKVREECAQVCEQNAAYKKQIQGCGLVSMKTVNVLFKTAMEIRAMKEPKS